MSTTATPNRQNQYTQEQIEAYESDSYVASIARHYASDAWPYEELLSVVHDVMRIISKVSSKYIDVTCFALRRDELEAEGRRKLIELLQGKNGVPLLSKVSKRTAVPLTRNELFKWMTAAINNHIKSIVNRHRNTNKRTVADESGGKLKPEISLDASPELRSSLEFQTVVSGCSDFDVEHDLEEFFTPLEFLVFSQYNTPSPGALTLAMIDAQRGKNPGEITVTDAHHAEALGLTTDELAAIGASITEKYKRYINDGNSAEMPVKETWTSIKASVFRDLLTAPELVVIFQLKSPNSQSVQLAKACRCQYPEIEHLAAGVGMSVALFSSIAERAKAKLKHYMEHPESHDKQHMAVSHLEDLFGLQVPRSLGPKVVRRLFTLAARAQFEKVTPEVANLLQLVGAEPPELNSGGNLVCFGVLYSRVDKKCVACHAKAACQAKAENFGLGSITLSPELLSARASVRTPIATDGTEDDAVTAVSEPASKPISEPAKQTPAAPSSEREEEIRAHLDGNYKLVGCYGVLYYKHTVSKAGAGHIARIEPLKSRAAAKVAAARLDINPAFTVRIVNAQEIHKPMLIKFEAGYYVPESWPVDHVKEFIDAHANYLFKHASQ